VDHCVVAVFVFGMPILVALPATRLAAVVRSGEAVEVFERLYLAAGAAPFSPIAEA
jgi:hypothetical protein